MTWSCGWIHTNPFVTRRIFCCNIKEDLSMNALRACVYIYIRRLIDQTVATCHILYTFLSLWKTDKTRKYSATRKWPPTANRRAKKTPTLHIPQHWNRVNTSGSHIHVWSQVNLVPRALLLPNHNEALGRIMEYLSLWELVLVCVGVAVKRTMYQRKVDVVCWTP